MHPISSRDENDSQSSTEEVSQLFTSTSRGAFPHKNGHVFILSRVPCATTKTKALMSISNNVPIIFIIALLAQQHNLLSNGH